MKNLMLLLIALAAMVSFSQGFVLEGSVRDAETEVESQVEDSVADLDNRMLGKGKVSEATVLCCRSCIFV